MASIAAGRASEAGGKAGGRNCFKGIWVAKAIGRASETAESTSGAIGRTFKEPRFY